MKKVNKIIEESEGLPTIIRCSKIEECDLLKISLSKKTDRDINIINCFTKDHEREEIFNRFQKSKDDIILCVDVIKEGIDIDNILCLIDTTNSPIEKKLIQYVGRGLRPLRCDMEALNGVNSADERKDIIANSNKPYLKLIEFREGSNFDKGFKSIYERK